MLFHVWCPWNSCPVVCYPWCGVPAVSVAAPSHQPKIIHPQKLRWCFLGVTNCMWQSCWCFCIDSFKEDTETTYNCLLFSCQSSVIIFFTNWREPSINLLLSKLPVNNLDLCYRNWMKQSTFLGMLDRSECSQKCLKSAHPRRVVENSAQTLPGKLQFPKASFALRDLLQICSPGLLLDWKLLEPWDEKSEDVSSKILVCHYECDKQPQKGSLLWNFVVFWLFLLIF